MDNFLENDTPSTLVALTNIVCHLTVPADDCCLGFAAGGDAKTRTTGVSLDETCDVTTVDVIQPASRVGGPRVLVSAAEDHGGGVAQRRQDDPGDGESAISRARTEAHRQTKRDKTFRKKERKRKQQVRRLYMLVRTS